MCQSGPNGKPRQMCVCEPAFHGISCEHQCPMGCSFPQGRCGANGTCECAPGFEGIGCSKAVCALNCSDHGTCINNTCVCRSPWVGPTCEYDSSCGGAGHGRFENGKCFCHEPYLQPDCTKKLVCSNSCKNGQCKLSTQSLLTFSTLSFILQETIQKNNQNVISDGDEIVGEKDETNTAEEEEEDEKDNGVEEIGRAVQQECRDRSRMPSSA
eukprot:TRINITY_DN21339_c0_g1_i1.p1 TRINITY_DN21339_c0_g1~~TRINITY_DN21339_c0_g1_i1.p1  ORF type:complete len:241 (+),score=25.50 TRINITY_DN21339_c0_g1_i1:89-724(+)